VSTPVRQIIRHSVVFGVGAVAARLASIVLLPLYTRYLTPADYGITAIVDLAVNMLGITIGVAVVGAATREHCSDETADHHDRVWWTALTMVIVIATIICGTAMMVRTPFATLIFGDTVARGPLLITIALCTLWLGSIGNTLESYFRAVKASTFLTLLGLSRLVINVFVNVVLIVWYHQGVVGILLGNLITTALSLTVLLVMFARERGAFTFSRRLMQPYWQFGWPLVVFGLLSACMHEADRYILRVYLDLHQVGLYSIGYQIGQGVNTLVITPFIAVWGVVVYEIAQRPDAPSIYTRVFKYYVFGLGLIMLGAALSARTLLYLLAPPEYAQAAALVPLICLGYLFFSLHEHFKVPAMTTGRTLALLPVVTISTIVNVVLNLVLVPTMGATGAAWATVATFLVFSGTGLYRYRQIEKYPYPFRQCAFVLVGMALTYVAHRALSLAIDNWIVEVVSGAVAWMAWAAILFGPLVSEQLPSLRAMLGRVQPTPAPVAVASLADATSALPSNER
jgi:O-antigen/teichoic acid export membrane protein